jgi:O-antigen ligase
MRAGSLATLDRVRPLAAFLDWLSGGVPGAARRVPALTAVGVLVVQLALLVVGWMFDPFLALAGGLLLLYAVVCVLSPTAAWLFTLACVPFSMESMFPAVSSALWLPTEPMIWIFLGVWGVRALIRGSHSLPSSPLLLAVVLLAAVAVLSATQCAYPILSAKALASTSWIVLFGLLFPLAHGRDLRLIRAAFWVMGVLALAFSLYGIAFVAANGLARWTGNAMGRPWFPEHGTYSSFVSFGLAALLGLTLPARSASARLGGAAGALAMAIAVIFSLARAAYLGLVGMAFVLVAPMLRRQMLRAAVVTAVVGGVIGGAVASFRAGDFIGLYVNSIAEPGEPSNLERISRWMAAMRMAEDRPLLGVGFGNYEETYYRYRVLTLRTQERFRRMSAHSEYFKVLGEMGWLGMAALAFFLAMLAREAMNGIRGAPTPSERALAIAAAAGITSYLVHGVFNNYGGIDKVAVPFWFLVATIAVVAARARAATP